MLQLSMDFDYYKMLFFRISYGRVTKLHCSRNIGDLVLSMSTVFFKTPTENFIILYCQCLDLGNKNRGRKDNIDGFGSLQNLQITYLPKLEILLLSLVREIECNIKLLLL